MTQVRTLLSGLVVGESPRWHQDRLWFCNWGAAQVVAARTDGTSEVMLQVPTTVPFCIDWLPDGRLLVVSGPEARVLRQEPDGTLSTYADLRHLAKGWNEIVVDSHANAYVNGSDFEFGGGGPFVPGVIAVITPDGAVRQVADDIHFPNGMVITPDGTTLIVAESFASRLTAFDIDADGSLSNRRVWAELGQGGDGICVDRDGAIWTSMTRDGGTGCARVAEGGEILDWIALDDGCFACALGGSDGRALFMLTAHWPGIERMAEMFSSHTGRVQIATAPVPAPTR